eukprot:13198180-Alexandrium_andersonii.AAC.1
MSASLVGSEMCIRDSPCTPAVAPGVGPSGARAGTSKCRPTRRNGTDIAKPRPRSGAEVPARSN